MDSKRIKTSSRSRYFLGVVSALFLSLASASGVKAQEYEEFTTATGAIKDSTSYILCDENGCYMKTGYDMTNRLRLFSTYQKKEASPFTFYHWYGDVYFVSVQLEGDEECFLARNTYDVLIFTQVLKYDEKLYGWDCSSGCMSLLTINHGWSTNYYLHYAEGEWDIDKYGASTIRMLQVDPYQDTGKPAGGSTGITEPEAKHSDHVIYNISGGKVKGKPAQHGIYIIDGKKVVY